MSSASATSSSLRPEPAAAPGVATPAVADPRAPQAARRSLGGQPAAAPAIVIDIAPPARAEDQRATQAVGRAFAQGQGLDIDHASMRAARGLQHDPRGLQVRPVAPINKATLDQVTINELLEIYDGYYLLINPEERDHINHRRAAEQEQKLEEVVRLLQGADARTQRNARIVVQILQRPDFNWDLGHDIFGHICDQLRIGRPIAAPLNPEEYAQLFEKLANELQIIGGPEIPHCDSSVFYRMASWVAAEKELLLSQFFTPDQVEHARRVIGQAWGLNHPDMSRPIANLKDPEEYVQVLQRFCQPAFLIQKIAAKIGSDQINNPGILMSRVSVQSICNKQIGLAGVSAFLATVSKTDNADSFFSEKREGAQIKRIPNANYAVFILEHMGFLTRENQEQPLPEAPLPALEVDPIFINMVTGMQKLADLNRFDYNNAKIEELQACVQNPRWIGVKPILERAIALCRAEQAIVQQKRESLSVAG